MSRYILITLALVSSFSCGNRGPVEVLWIPGGELEKESGNRLFVQPVFYDSFEVRVVDYRACVAAGACDGNILRHPYPGCDWQPKRCSKADLRYLCTYYQRNASDHPINCVTLDQAMDYCRWVGGRLPTPAEWMWAAGGRDENRLFPWGTATPTCQVVVMGGCSEDITAPVGSAPAGVSRDGIFDLVGNVAELLVDSDGRAYAAGGSAQDYHGPSFLVSTSGIGPLESIVSAGSPVVGFRCIYESSSYP